MLRLGQTKPLLTLPWQSAEADHMLHRHQASTGSAQPASDHPLSPRHSSMFSPAFSPVGSARAKSPVEASAIPAKLLHLPETDKTWL